jgi:hypothetical protein
MRFRAGGTGRIAVDQPGEDDALLLAAIAVQFALNGLEQTALFHK